MAEKTPNFNLTKPLESEFYDINVQNGNMDKIDQALQGHADQIFKLQEGAGTEIQETLTAHINNKNNPHGVTAADVGAAPASHTHSAADVGALPANGTAAAATKLATARTIQTNLGSTAAPSFDGTANVLPGVTGVLSTMCGGTGNSSGYVREGQKAETTIGSRATAEGRNTTASGECAHAEGRETTASNYYSHAEGWGTTASGQCAHAEGTNTTASGNQSHAEGADTTASNYYSHAEGRNTTASGECAHAEGWETTASNYCSHAGGKYGKATKNGANTYNNVGDVFVLGNGQTGSSNPAIRSNAFRVTYAGETYGLTSFKTSGADYAEYFEWQDGNPQADDRVGRFVTMTGRHIRIAAPGDYILGVVSGQPCIIGNADEDWLGRWEHDEFGRFVKRYMVEDKTEIDPPADDETRMELLHNPQVKEENGRWYRSTPRYVD